MICDAFFKKNFAKTLVISTTWSEVQLTCLFTSDSYNGVSSIMVAKSG